jgi:KR domain/Zinc-binding dehydrogenase
LLTSKKIFATVSTDAKKEYLVENFCINPTHIFSSRDTSFLEGVLEATNGRGVDIVLNSLTGDMLHASWKCCASFGRFIEIGKRDLTDAGRLEMEQFLKNATFSAFDLSNIYYHDNPAYHKLWSKLLDEVLDLYRQKKIAKIEPLEVFDVSDITKALRRFSSRTRMGKIAINLENPMSSLSIRPFKHKTTFHAGKTYIMVGCLGGLGRSISKWMFSRGARKFIFLGRSGLDKGPARHLVKDLKRYGADCRVIRGDVRRITDVQMAVDQVDGLIGGVIQATMVLKVSVLFPPAPRRDHYHHENELIRARRLFSQACLTTTGILALTQK